MSLGKHLLRGSGANLLDHAVKMVSVFYITPLMRRSLGDDGYGSWLLAMSVIGYFVLLDAGVTFASARFFARAVGAGDTRHQGAIESETRRMLRFIAAGILFCTLAAIPLMPWIASRKFSAMEVTAPLAICGVVTAIRFAYRMPVIMLRAHVRYDMLAWASIVRTLAQMGGMSWVLMHGYGLIGAAVAHGSGEMLELLLQTLWARRLPKTQACDLPEDERRTARRELFAYSNSVLLVNIGDSLRLQVNPLLISRMFGVAEVPVYSIGLRLITILEDVVNALFGGQVLSVFSQLHGAGKHDELRAQFRRVTRMTSIFGAWAVGGAVFVSEPFFKRWMGADFGRAHDVLFILAFPYALRFMQFPSHSLIYTISAPKWLIWVNFAGGFVTVILSLLLGPLFGLHGVVMGTALEMCAVYLFIMPFMVGRLAQIHPVRHLLEDVLWPGIKALAIPALYGWALSSWLTPDFTRLFLFGAGYTLVFAVSAPFMALDKETRGTIWRLLPKPFRS